MHCLLVSLFWCFACVKTLLLVAAAADVVQLWAVVKKELGLAADVGIQICRAGQETKPVRQLSELGAKEKVQVFSASSVLFA